MLFIKKHIRYSRIMVGGACGGSAPLACCTNFK